MINSTNRIFVLFLSALFLIAAACYGYSHELFFLALPLVAIAAVLLLQFPHFLFYVLVLSIPWSFEYTLAARAGTDLPDEPLMILAALSVLIFLVYQRKNLPPIPLHPLLLVLGCGYIWAIAATITSTSILLSVKYLLAKGWYLLAFAILPVFLFSNRKVLKTSAVLLFLSMMAVTLVSLVRQAMNHWSFEKVNDSLSPFFRNHVNYSSLLILMVPLGIAFLQLTSSTWVRRALYLLLLVTVAAVYFSYARGAWLALLAGMAGYWLFYKRLLTWAFLCFIALVLGGVLFLRSDDRYLRFSNDYRSTIFHSELREHLIATYELKDLSNAERIYRWVAGVRMAGDKWMTGFGPSTFYHQYKSYTLPAFKTYVSKNPEQSTVHNYFLLLLIEQGVPGCLLFIALVASMFGYAQKIYGRTDQRFWKVVVSAVAVILVMECVINFLSDMIETDKVGSIFYLCFATLLVADRMTREEASDPGPHIERVAQTVPE